MKRISINAPVSIPIAAFLVLAILAQASESLQAATLGKCEGGVLQRRFALVKFGEWAERFIADNGALPDICDPANAGLVKSMPNILASARVCGDGESGIVYYQCELEPEPGDDTILRIIETCSYSLKNQTLSCVNNSVSATLAN